MSKELIKVCAYCRVSTESESQASSFEHQQKFYTEKLSKENGFELVKIYSDLGISGTKWKNRDSFNEMLKDAGLDIKVAINKVGSIQNNNSKINYFLSNREPKFKYIYCKNSSRLARHLGILEVIDLLRQKGVYIFFEDLNRSTEDTSNDLLLSFISVIDANFSKDLSTRVRWGASQSAKDGKIRVGRELFGYTYDKKENTLRIIESEAEVVKLMFKLRLENKGSRLIAKHLKEKGIKTRKDVDWLPHVINRTLQNPHYKGCLCRNKWDCDSLSQGSARKLKPQSEWVIEKSPKVDQIIDDETFDKVQEAIKGCTANGISKGKYQGRTEYATKIKCAICGANYMKNSEIRKGVKKEWYNCKTKKTQGVKMCASKSIMVEDIDELVGFFTKEGQMKKTTQNFIEVINNKLEEKIASTRVNIDEDRINFLNEEIKIREEKITRILDVYSEGDISKDIFVAKKDALNKEIEIFKTELDATTDSEDEREKKIADIEELIKELNKIADSCPLLIEKETFIKDYLKHIVVKEDGKMQIITIAHELFGKLNIFVNQLK